MPGSFVGSRRILLSGGGGFNPLSLFKDGTDGFLYEPLLGLMYQTEDTSTPVTAGGQAVGRVEDRSPANSDATQSTSGSRMTFTAGSPGYLLGDSSADHLITDITPGASGTTIAACFLATGSATAIMGSDQSSGINGCYLYIHTNGRLGAGWCDLTVSDLLRTGVITGAPHVALLRGLPSGVVQLWYDGELADEETAGEGINPVFPLLVGAINRGGSPISPLKGRVYRAIALQKYIPDNKVVPLMRWLGRGVVSF